ncbi:MAG TPA: hypothetical protein VNT29_07705, partial [Candidatus Limnocylindrales bacterium]|nr:hypothetical protein [Candidatus Limnocylindrales bacterium]
SLQVAWNRRFISGLLFGVTYTYSHTTDDGSDKRDIIPDTYDAHGLYGNSDFDFRHVFITNFMYELPLFKGQNNLASKLLGGWQVSGIFQAQSGAPWSVGRNQDYAGVGQDGSMNGTAIQYWSFSGGDIKYPGLMAHNGSADPNSWISVPLTPAGGLAQFSAPANNSFVTQNIARNLVYGPGFNNWNLGLFKKFAVNERTGFQFRAEAFDAFNHPNFCYSGGSGCTGNGVSLDPSNLATFGKVTGKANDARNLQLSLRFYF